MPQAVFDGQDGGRRYRKQIASAVLRLKPRHERDRTSLSHSTVQLVRSLSTEVPGIPCAACIGSVVTAKHFAGTQSPRQDGARPAARPTTPRRSRASTARRLMFAEDQPQSTSAERPDTVSQPASIRRKHRASDDEWRLDIWRSHGRREVQPPSPFGPSDITVFTL